MSSFTVQFCIDYCHTKLTISSDTTSTDQASSRQTPQQPSTEQLPPSSHIDHQQPISHHEQPSAEQIPLHTQQHMVQGHQGVLNQHQEGAWHVQDGHTSHLEQGSQQEHRLLQQQQQQPGYAHSVHYISIQCTLYCIEI